MRLNIDLSQTIPKLLKESGCTRFQFFMIMSVTATGIAAGTIRDATPLIDWSDPGVLAIFASVACACYLAIWLFVKKISS